MTARSRVSEPPKSPSRFCTRTQRAFTYQADRSVPLECCARTVKTSIFPPHLAGRKGSINELIVSTLIDGPQICSQRFPAFWETISVFSDTLSKLAARFRTPTRTDVAIEVNERVGLEVSIDPLDR